MGAYDPVNPPPSRARRRNLKRAIGRHNKRRRRRLLRPAQEHWLRQVRQEDTDE